MFTVTINHVPLLQYPSIFRLSRLTAVGRGHSADRQRRRKKKHLIEVAPFGCFDQILSTSERRPKKKHLIEATPFGHLDQMVRTTERRQEKSI